MEASAAAGGGRESNKKEEESLPPGFRFHPTDEELITYYLRRKIADGRFTARAIAEVDLNKSEPWDLPGNHHRRNQLLINLFMCIYSYTRTCTCICSNLFSSLLSLFGTCMHAGVSERNNFLYFPVYI
jgi:hypothetical protein